jgi:hypothetical protein
MGLLRHGVEVHSSQSFLACISNAKFYGEPVQSSKHKIQTTTKRNVPTIKEFKSILIQMTTLDLFIQYQNGDLATIFATKQYCDDKTVEQYSNTTLYKKTMTDTSPNKSTLVAHLKNTISAFENFKRLLKDDKTTLDYTYLWDLICMPNPHLFENGINLIILEIPDDDVTNNIDLICPTNHYSKNIYEPTRKSLILIKRDNFFEPIYYYKLVDGRVKILKMFAETDPGLPQNIRRVFSNTIKHTLGSRCRAIQTTREYKFKQPPLLDDLILSIKDNYTIRS